MVLASLVPQKEQVRMLYTECGSFPPELGFGKSLTGELGQLTLDGYDWLSLEIHGS